MPLFSVVGSTLALALEDTLLLTDTSSPDAPVVRCVKESAHQASSAAADGDGDAGADAEADTNADGGDAAATGGIVAVALNADGSLAVTAHNDKELRVWRVADGTCVSRRTLAKKPTTMLTNSLCVFQELDGSRCPKTHDHVAIMDSEMGQKRSKWAQTYPSDLCHAMIRGITKELADS